MSTDVKLTELLKKVERLRKPIAMAVEHHGFHTALKELDELKATLIATAGPTTLHIDGNMSLEDLADIGMLLGMSPQLVFLPQPVTTPGLEKGTDCPEETMTLRLGDVVELKDTTKGFRWKNNDMHDMTYDVAIVACLAPLVLVATDCKARWKESVRPNDLRVVTTCSEALMHKTRYCLSQEELVATQEVTRLEVRP